VTALVDTSVLAAAASRRDTLHAEAVSVVTAHAKQRLVAPMTVLTETMCLIRARYGPDAQTTFWDGFTAAGIEVVSLDDAMLNAAREIERRYADTAYGFVDATLLATCESLRCARVLSFDRRLAAYRPSFATALEVLP
jgi:predicted nucleic acid-binding protein